MSTQQKSKSAAKPFSETIKAKLKDKPSEVETPQEALTPPAVQDTIVPEVQVESVKPQEVKPEVKAPSEVKAEPVKKEKAKEAVPEKEVFNGVEIDAAKTYIFKLKHKANPRTLLPREVKVWDEATESTRLIRLCSVENSPYADEQDENSVLDRTPIAFAKGELYVAGTEKNKIRYLLAYDGYDKKQKTLSQNINVKDFYELVDTEAITEASLDKQEAELEAKNIVKDAELSELSDFLRARFLSDVENMSDKALRSEGYTKAGENPYLFLNSFTDPLNKVKANVQKLFSKGLLDDNGGSIRWTDTNAVIMTIDPTKGRADDVLAKWVLIGSKDSQDFKKVMESKL